MLFILTFIKNCSLIIDEIFIALFIMNYYKCYIFINVFSSISNTIYDELTIYLVTDLLSLLTR